MKSLILEAFMVIERLYRNGKLIKRLNAAHEHSQPLREYKYHYTRVIIVKKHITLLVILLFSTAIDFIKQIEELFSV